MIRSLVFIPAHKIAAFDSISNHKPDAVCFDLEDSLPKNKKNYGISQLNFFLKSNKIRNLKLFVRIEDLESNNIDYIEKIMSPQIDSIVLSKISNVEKLIKFEKNLRKLEIKKKIKKKISITFLIESILGVYNLEKLINCSSRVENIIYGEEDFLNDYNYLDFSSLPNLDFYKSYISFLGKKNDLGLIYTPYLYIKNNQGLRKHIIESKKFGFGGILVVHPSQINYANKLYLPNKKNLNIALKIINSNKSSKYENQNISLLKGKLVGPPMIKRAKKLLKFFESYK